MDCPRCQTLVERDAEICWMCHSPLSWQGDKPQVTGPPLPNFRTPKVDEAQRTLRRRTNRLAGLMLLALILLALGGAFAYRAYLNQSDQVTRDNRGYVKVSHDGVSLTFPDKPDTKDVKEEGVSLKAFVVDRAKDESLLAAGVMNLPDGAPTSGLADPALVETVAAALAQAPGVRVTQSNQFSLGDLVFFDISLEVVDDDKTKPLLMRIIAGKDRIVYVMAANVEASSPEWIALRDEVRID